MAGHVGFGDGCYVYEDALYAAVRVLSIRQASDETLAGFRDSLPQLASTPELRVHCPEARKKAVVEEVRARLAAEGAQVTALDGLRVREGGGWWLLRASNTEAALTLRCEAPDEPSLQAWTARITAQPVASALTPPPFYPDLLPNSPDSPP